MTLTHRDALDLLDTLPNLHGGDHERLSKSLSKIARRHDDADRLVILEEARTLAAENAQSLQAKFGGLIAEARAAFLTDTSYAVGIAEEAAAKLTRSEYRANPDQQKADALRLYAQGADAEEIHRALRMAPPRVREVLRDAPERRSETPQKAAQDAPRPVVRPVTVRYTTPRKTAEQTQQVERKPWFRPHKAYPEVEVVTAKPVEHGLSRYKGGCRCDVCKQAKADSRKSKGLRRPNGTIPEHGTTTRYTKHGCRCGECRSAMAAHARNYRAGKSGD